MFVPWQPTAKGGRRLFLAFFTSVGLATVNGYLDWYPIVTGALLIVGYFALMSGVLTFLSLSRTFSTYALLSFVVLVALTIAAFALHYHSSGLLVGRREFIPDFWDALYFSVTTFTTLGYGDFQPPPEHRLTTSMEALLGMLFMATLVSFIWLRFNENLLPQNMTLLEGMRIGNPDPILTRMQIRKTTGEELKSQKYEDFVEGEPYYYDKYYKEWTPVADREALPDDATVIVRKGRTFDEDIPGSETKPDRKD